MKNRISTVALTLASIFVTTLLASSCPSQEFLNGIPPLTGAAYNQVYVGDVPTGTNDIYTCPTGKRALVCMITYYNHDSAGRTVQAKVKISSIYYKISQPIPLSANAANHSFGGLQGPYVLNAGEILAVDVAEALAASVNVLVRLIEFSDAGCLKTIRLNTLSVGLNTFYTCPAGRKAIILTSGILNPWDKTVGAILMVNNSGATRSIQTYFVSSGGSASTSNQFSNISLTNTSISQIGVAGNLLSPGDSIVIGVDASAGEFTAYGTIFEF